ncbi:hypothetical protein [Planktotalea sp.]|uniref:hypothetical protein n=1 Tax=Planktotalea sp. TaxID=2029877 RepID=UPI003D6AB17C
MPYYDVKLGKAYHAQGFFNIGVAVEKYIDPADRAEITIDVFGYRKLHGKMDRTTNGNGTPRIFGSTELRDWFNSNFKMFEFVRVYFVSPTEVRLEKAPEND